jgi:hypothetical protein
MGIQQDREINNGWFMIPPLTDDSNFYLLFCLYHSTDFVLTKYFCKFGFLISFIVSCYNKTEL